MVYLAKQALVSGNPSAVVTPISLGLNGGRDRAVSPMIVEMLKTCSNFRKGKTSSIS